MKNLLLCSIIVIVLCSLISCSQDNPIDIVPNASAETDPAYALKANEQSPDNSANAFDSAGKLYSDLSQAFLDLDTLSGSMAGTIEMVEVLADRNSVFLALKPNNYTSPTANQIEHILDDEQVSMADIILNSQLSIKAKYDLREFIDSVMAYKYDDVSFETVYDYIVGFEENVVQDTSYTSNDRRILLTTTSITRHGLHFKRKRKSPRDRDWDISWGSITAGTQGSEENTAKAVIMSVVTGIGLNNSLFMPLLYL